MKELSPSILPKLAECALYEGAAGTSDAASRGTAIDIAIRNNYYNENEILGDDSDVINYGISELRRLSKGSRVEMREEYLAMAVPGLSRLGTADAICIAEKWVADIKTGQVRNYREQLAAYALACMEDHFATTWTAHVIYVDQQMVRSYDFTYDQAKQIVSRVIDNAKSKLAEPTPCEYCSWCAHYGSCHAIARQARGAIALFAETKGSSIDAIKERILSNPKTLGAFAAEWKMAEKAIADPVIAELKSRLESGDEIAGWKLKIVSGRKFVETDAIAKAAESLSKETLILALGGKMSEKSYLELCSNNAVDPDPTAIKAGSPITQLRQTKIK